MLYENFKAYMKAKKANQLWDDEELDWDGIQYGIPSNIKPEPKPEPKLLGPVSEAELNNCRHYKISGCRSRHPNDTNHWCHPCLKVGEEESKKSPGKQAAEQFFKQMDEYAESLEKLNGDTPPNNGSEEEDVNEMTVEDYTLYFLDRVANFLLYISDKRKCGTLQAEDRTEAYTKWQDLTGLIKQLKEEFGEDDDDEEDDDDDENIIDLDMSKFEVIENGGEIELREQAEASVLERVLMAYERRGEI